MICKYINVLFNFILFYILGYEYKAVIAFHVVKKSCFIITKGEDESEKKEVVWHSNFDASSRQMEYAILIALLEQITLILEESDLLLEVCIDKDLDSNKTLANVSVVIEIYADLKHVSKNIWKNLCIVYYIIIIICWYFIIILSLLIFIYLDNSKKAICTLSQFWVIYNEIL